MKVKVSSAKGNQFKFSPKSTLTSQIEEDINHWLENNPKINIPNIKQSSKLQKESLLNGKRML